VSEDTLPGGEDTLPGPSLAPPYRPNAGDPEQVDAATIAAQHRAMREVTDLATVLAAPEGRRVIMRLMRFTGIHALSSQDPVRGQRDEGARSVGLAIMDLLGQQGISVFPTMLLEEAKQAEVDAATLKAAAQDRPASD
jgi:hypothetical protein